MAEREIVRELGVRGKDKRDHVRKRERECVKERRDKER